VLPSRPGTTFVHRPSVQERRGDNDVPLRLDEPPAKDLSVNGAHVRSLRGEVSRRRLECKYTGRNINLIQVCLPGAASALSIRLLSARRAKMGACRGRDYQVHNHVTRTQRKNVCSAPITHSNTIFVFSSTWYLRSFIRSSLISFA
jgi:hypothetical protein